MTSKKDHYLRNIFLFRLIGLWPYQKSSRRTLHVRLISIIMISITVIHLYLIIMSLSNIEQVIEYLRTFLPALCFTCCYTNLNRNFATVKGLFDRISSDWTTLTDQRKINVMKKFALESKLYTMIIAVLFYLYIVVLITPSLIRVILNFTGIFEDIRLTLPVPIESWMIKLASYYLMLLCEYFCMILMSTIGIAHYSMYISFIQHAYALCGIVIIMLDQPLENKLYHSWRTQPNNVRSEDYYWIVAITKYYGNVTSFVDLINVIYSKTYLVEVSVGILYVIIDYLSLFELMEVGNMNKIIINCVNGFASIFMAFVLCFIGQRLIDHNNYIIMKCCQIPFYALSIKSQRVLLLLTMRSMRPFGLSVKGMLVSSHELFANIMRTAFSFATVFYNMR